jgi:SAM-dependent methyltransferase
MADPQAATAGDARLRDAADMWDVYQDVPALDGVAEDALGDQGVGQLSSVTPDYLRDLAARLGIGARHHVMDGGCGSGGLTLALAHASGCEVTGVDISPGAVEVAARRAAARRDVRARFLVGDMARPSLPAGSVDAVVCLGSAYWSDPATTVASWDRLLRPGVAAIALVVSRVLLPQSDLDRDLIMQRGLFAPHPDWEGALVENGFDVELTDLSAPDGAYLERAYGAMSERADALRAEMGRAEAHLFLAQYARLVEFHRDGVLRRVEVTGRRAVI